MILFRAAWDGETTEWRENKAFVQAFADSAKKDGKENIRIEKLDLDREDVEAAVSLFIEKEPC